MVAARSGRAHAAATALDALHTVALAPNFDVGQRMRAMTRPFSFSWGDAVEEYSEGRSNMGFGSQTCSHAIKLLAMDLPLVARQYQRCDGGDETRAECRSVLLTWCMDRRVTGPVRAITTVHRSVVFTRCHVADLVCGTRGVGG